MTFDAFIRDVFAWPGRRWRVRAMRARAAFEQDADHQSTAPVSVVVPAGSGRRRVPELRRVLTHACLIFLAVGAVLGDRVLSLPIEDRAVLTNVPPQALDQPLRLALAPLPLRSSTGDQASAALSPAVSEPVELPSPFQTQHVLSVGETLGAIAEQYAISLEALIWVNGLEQGDALVEGQVLQIPRTSGLFHEIDSDETLEAIAAVYDVSPEVIFGFAPNRLDGYTLSDLPAGAAIFIPGATRALPEELLSFYGGFEGLAARGPVFAGRVLADETNVRDGPSTEHQRLFQLEAGRQVALIARYDEWVYIALGARTGWLRNDLIAADPAMIAELTTKTDFPEPPPRWVWPARGTISSRFGPRWGGFHNGLDIANRAWTPIIAARSGVVREAGWCSGYGYCVKLRHPGGVETIYGHLIAQPVVTAGDSVTVGQLIGHMGSTYDRAGGGYSTGVHLHFTVIIGGRAVDPLKVLP